RYGASISIISRLSLTGATVQLANSSCASRRNLQSRVVRGWKSHSMSARTGSSGRFTETAAFLMSSSISVIVAALNDAGDMTWVGVGDASFRAGLEAIADLMAFITARNGIIAIFQGPAETGPRALGHWSIVANPCNPRTTNASSTAKRSDP